MLLAIEYIHNSNICHRDIKAENAMISNKGDAILVDFGVFVKFI
jgi:serine/threonine protein kinase